MRVYISPSDLTIETDDQGFIIGKSLIGDNFTDAAHAWRPVTCDFSQLSLNMGVALEKGVLFRPEAATLSLRTPTTNYMSGAFGRQIRIKWKNQVLFVGEMKSAKLASQAGHDEDKTYMDLTAIGLVQKASTYVLYEFDAPTQTTGDRITAAAANTGIGVQAINCLRVMPAHPQANRKLIDVLQDAADVQMARFYANRENTLILNSNPVTVPKLSFSDKPEDTNAIWYRSLDMSEDLDNVITGAVVKAKQFESRYGITRHQSAVVQREETYEIDLPDTANDIDAWKLSFPLIGYTRLQPSGIDMYWQESLMNLDLTDLVLVKWKGNSYQCGIKSIRYSIRPDIQNGLRWDVSIELMPGHVVQRLNVAAPSAPENFQATTVGPTNATVTWSRPAMPGNLTGYAVRYKEGTTAPTANTNAEGTLWANYGPTQFGANITGLKAYTYYSFAVFATTGSAAITSPATTTLFRTQEITPSAPRNFTVTKDYTFRINEGIGTIWTMMHDIRLTAPATGTVDHYEVFWTLDGRQATRWDYDGSLTTGVGGYDKIVGNGVPGVDLNVMHKYAIYAVSPGGVYSIPAFTECDSNETIPPTMPAMWIEKRDTQTWRIHFSSEPEQSKDFNAYLLEWKTTGDGQILEPRKPGTNKVRLYPAQAESRSYVYDVIVAADGVFLDVSIFSETHGRLWSRNSATIITN